MTTNAEDFRARGMNFVTALELASQIDGTPDATKLMALGVPVPLANELAAQMLAGTGVVSNLMALGMPPLLAEKVAADITAAGP